ncbi:peptidoglycan-recognition protein SC2-like [Macrosteles quadrilineatus]|uniref:peptidoglycan-recognition protein SC2-like n=1 Tax=Macrosteles quadrilineatus TaxID=74068 RepID=UPI0023E0A293|nr:peptidoglycan-recognition protein SC2-like [Macrosteles quadrilineatus]
MFLAKLLLKPTIITRGQWGAEKPLKEGEPIEGEVSTLVLKFTQTQTCSTKKDCIERVKEVQKRHMEEEGLPDIQHNFLIGGDGNVYEGRGFNTYPVYSEEEENFKPLVNSAFEIAFIGKISDKPSMKMLKSLAGVVMKGMEEKKITKDVKKIKPYIIHGKDVMMLKDKKGSHKDTKQLIKEYKELLEKEEQTV